MTTKEPSIDIARSYSDTQKVSTQHSSANHSSKNQGSTNQDSVNQDSVNQSSTNQIFTNQSFTNQSFTNCAVMSHDSTNNASTMEDDTASYSCVSQSDSLQDCPSSDQSTSVLSSSDHSPPDNSSPADSKPADSKPDDSSLGDSKQEHSPQERTLFTAGGIPLDADTMARAALTFCIDGADALMYALIRGAESIMHVLYLLVALVDGKNHNKNARNELDLIFATGVARWGRHVDARGMASFHTALERWLRRLSLLPVHDATALAATLSQNGSQWIIAPHSPYWPQQLADLSIRSDWAPPLCLWGKGEPSALTRCSSPLAIVGSRSANDYGSQTAHIIAKSAAEDGHLVISGGAMGIDAAAHNGALCAANTYGGTSSGITVAVFAGGLNRVGPQCNRRLFDRIVDNGGALISELCPDTIPEARRFLLRNRLIAALSSSVVVAQARLRSGALNTANWAAELGRPVYAIPGDITKPNNAGCNKLIHDGKAIIIRTTDCIKEICHSAHTPSSVPTMNSNPTSMPMTVPAVQKNSTMQKNNDNNASTNACIGSNTNINANINASNVTNANTGNTSANRTNASSAAKDSNDTINSSNATIVSPVTANHVAITRAKTADSDTADDSNVADKSSHTDDRTTANGNDIITAIRTCSRKHEPATAETIRNVLAVLAGKRSHNAPHIDDVLTQLALLELEGQVIVENGQYTVTPVARTTDSLVSAAHTTCSESLTRATTSSDP